MNRGMKVLQTLALPLGYSATLYLIKKMERETRFELATSALARRRSTTEPFPHTSIYAFYIAFVKKMLVGATGLEPVTLCL